MDQSERQKRIVQYLEIKPINHGQVHSFQIAIPESERLEISPERREILERSLKEQDSNLIPLIVRRTEAYDEEKEYEVVHGVDWCIVANEIGIEKLWVWVFDLTDEQAELAKYEMEKLLALSTIELEEKQSLIPKEGTINLSDLAKLLDKKLQPMTTKLNELATNSTTVASSNFQAEKNTTIQKQLEVLFTKINQLSNKVEEIQKQLSSNVQPSPATISAHKLNLQEATKTEIEEKLNYLGVNHKQITAAWNAIEKWKKSDEDLTWGNLEQLAKSKDKKLKVSGFGKTTYDKLREIAEIPK
ncbi:MAG: hypothetical protein F6K54_15350 [Okeania sp. SIO3B5]|uniref:hypothetical protein n=1 Tax=Okeania sp. SIO3B5 TaxID=2607811 RepID=UPI00140137FF|nr:hypothetical protein [Okeania sp. SIO3B5]NEO54338.1 hypothetical protein [Okeania sp. SIO3B5]